MIHIITKLIQKYNRNFPLALSFDDVLLVPQYSEIETRSEIDLSTQLTPRIRLQIPLISANMSDVTGVEMAIELARLGGLGVLPRFNTIDQQANMVAEVKKHNLIVAAAVGCKDWKERAQALVNAGVEILVLDVAHGHLKKALETTRNLKSTFGRLVDIISGNVATREAANDLFSAGADCVKVGIGPGSICTTRIQTGNGVPQITAILETSIAARKHKKTIIADGGTKSPGDIVKGLAAGADAIMIGSQFAGTKESPGKIVKIGKKTFKTYNASTSFTEKTNHIKNSNLHLSSQYVKQIEGIESLVPYKGSLKSVVDNILAGVRSGFSYSGSRNIQELHKKARFIRITDLGMRESLPHDVIPLKKA